jgi:6-phosphogluconolactonase
MKSISVFTLFFAGILFFASCSPVKNKQVKEILYVGTFAGRNSQGLYVFEFNRDSLSFKLLQTLPELVSPSFFTLHPAGRFLYAACRNSMVNGQNWGSIWSLKIDTISGMLAPLNQRPSYGADPCYISTDQSGQYIFVANYGDGVISVYPVSTDGSIGDSIQVIRHAGRGINPQRQEGTHVHAALVSEDDRFVYVPDLGIDKVMIYKIDTANGKLTPADVPWAEVKPGSGPRHIAIHPDGKFAYLAEELGSTAAVFLRDTFSGSLTEIQRVSSIPDDYTGENTNADIHTDPEGRFLYVSNRGHNSIAIYSINRLTGMLSLAGFEPVRGDHPRNFMIDDTGDLMLVANRNTDQIVIFRRNKQTGMLTYSGKELNVPAPVCVKMMRLE